jgi:hypothetical protein
MVDTLHLYNSLHKYRIYRFTAAIWQVYVIFDPV